MAKSGRGRIPWKTPRGVDAVVEDWLESRIVKPCLTADETLPPRASRTAPFPTGMPTPIAFALRGRGVTELYDHQARAFVAARDPRTRALVVATPTASGKSYCFHLPVLSTMLEDRDARALYLYPTKALARDQEAGLREIMRAIGLEPWNFATRMRRRKTFATCEPKTPLYVCSSSTTTYFRFWNVRAHAV